MKNIVRRLVLLFVAVFLISGFCPVTANAEQVCGEYEYRIEDDGTATITKYKGWDSEVVVPAILDGYMVKKIAQYAFYNVQAESISLSEGIVTTEQNWACECYDLEEVYYPSTVKMLTGDACLKEGNNPGTCDKLTTIKVSSKNPYITVYNGDLYSKDKKTFLMHPTGSDSTKLVIAEGVTVVAYNAASWVKNLTTIIWPDSLVKIGAEAFCNLGVEKISLPGNCQYLGEHAFYGAEATEVSIPAATTEISPTTFAGMKNLTKFIVNNGNKIFTVKEKWLYDKTKDMIVDYPGKSSVTKLTIPAGTKIIGESACSNLFSVEEVILPDSVEELANSAFFNSNKLKRMVIPPNVKKIGKAALGYCFKMESITFQGHAPQIADKAFERNKVKVYYPSVSNTWTDNVKQSYGANKITWEVYTPNVAVPDMPYKVVNVVKGVHVYWKKTENAVGYGLWRSENNIEWTFQKIADTQATHYTDTNVVSGKKYYYRVSAMKLDGKHTAQSPMVDITYISTPDITGRSNKSAGIQIGWNKANGATGYAIYRKIYTGTDAWKRVATIFGNATFTWLDQSVKDKNGTVYKYTVRALAGSDKKTLSGCRNTGRTMARLASRTLSGAVKAGKNSIKCTWNTSSAVTGYEVRFMVGSKVYKTFTVGNYKTGVKTFTGLAAGKTYKIQVRSYKKVDGVGSFYSAWSVAKNVSL